MKFLVLISALLVVSSPNLFARSVNRVDNYDTHGRYLGTSCRMGNTTQYLDAEGKYQGEVVSESKNDYASYTGQGKYNGNTYVNGNSFEYFDGHGKFAGSGSVEGRSYEYFDSHDHYQGGAYSEGASSVSFDKHGR